MTTAEILNQLYYVEHNLDGVDKLLKKAKKRDASIKKKDVQDWLNKQHGHQINVTKVIKKKHHLPIYSESHDAWQIDLTFIPQYKIQNNGNYILFTAIHINSRFVYASYASNKLSSTILQLMMDFVKKHKPSQIDGDKGSEFINSFFIDYLKKQKIGYVFYKSDSHKLGIINRFHRTLKEKIQKWISVSGSVKWITIIDSIIKNYNDTQNRGIGATPNEVFNSPLLQDLIIEEKRLKSGTIHERKEDFKIDDFVRIAIKGTAFTGMKQKNSSEIYRVIKVLTNSVRIVNLDDIEFTYKKSQLVKVNENIENYVSDEPVIKAKRENKIVRLNRKEDLIDAPMETRTRRGGKR